jgi:aquaporin Z
MRRYLTEFLGTYFLVVTVGFTAASGTLLAPLAIGAALMVMVYMGGHVSGAHYNPAVSLAVLIRGKLNPVDLLPYLVFQFAAGLAAAYTVAAVTGQTFAPAPAAGVPPWTAMAVEALFTFALCLVVLHTATARATQGNAYFGLAIGFTVTAAAVAAGPVSGGAFNPAVGVGPTVVHHHLGGGTLDHLGLYFFGPLLGGVAAALVFKLQTGEGLFTSEYVQLPPTQEPPPRRRRGYPAWDHGDPEAA